MTATALFSMFALLCSGCYWTFGTAPPAGARLDVPGAPPGMVARRPDCTRSRALPIIDTIIAVEGAFGTGLGLIGMTVRDDGSLPAGEARALGTMVLIVGAPMLILGGLSAYGGYRQTARCRAWGGT